MARMETGAAVVVNARGGGFDIYCQPDRQPPGGIYMGNYDRNTIFARNPLARFAHRNRVKRSVELAFARLGDGRLLDYGCGSGVLINSLLQRRPGCAVGYEPFMQDRFEENLPIFRELKDLEAEGPYKLVTLFETIEHLSSEETDEFIEACERLLASEGEILISAPIEIGPALFVKELNRFVLKLKRSEHRPLEFLKASLLGIPARRAEDLKRSHRGFDFRRAADYLRSKGWAVEILAYGPLPIGTWYGNSQVYLTAKRSGV